MSAECLSIERRAGAAPGVCILMLRGPLQMETVPYFLKTVRAEKAPVIILDMTAVTYMDSAGIGALVQTLISLRTAKRRLALAGPNARVRSVMEVTRVESQFQIASTAAEAETLVG